jgi:hypothetical protein
MVEELQENNHMEIANIPAEQLQISSAVARDVCV